MALRLPGIGIEASELFTVFVKARVLNRVLLSVFFPVLNFFIVFPFVLVFEPNFEGSLFFVEAVLVPFTREL